MDSIVTPTTGGCETVTTASADRSGSAALVARIWNVPGDAGAVYWPPEVMLPPPASSTDQTTVPLALPVTVAENCRD